MAGVRTALGLRARDLRCSSSSACVVSGFFQSPEGSATTPVATVLYSTDGGSNWATASVPSGLGPLSSFDCGDSSNCVASSFGGEGPSSEVLGSTDSGRSWSEADALGLPVSLVTSLSCSSSTCWAAGISGASSDGSNAVHLSLANAVGLVATTGDGGQSWQQAGLPQGVLAVVGISCPTGARCYALALDK